MRARRGGFTLLELLAVVALTALVLTVAVDFYIDLSRHAQTATERTRAARRATAVLDRVAADLALAVLVVKPAARDPLSHPWLFFAEARDDDVGADRLKFVTYNHRARSGDAHESDLAVVSYATRLTEGDSVELVRSSESRLPEGLDRSIPLEEADGALLLADDLASFGVRLLAESGEWQTTWDSSTVAQASQLPLAAEIEVALWAGDGEEADRYARRVLLPVRPIDLEALLEGTAGEDDADDDEEDEEQDPNCPKVGECVALGGLTQEQQDLVNGMADQCYERAGMAAVVPPGALLCD